MPQYIKDAYKLFCGVNAQSVYDFLYLKYYEKELTHIYLQDFLEGTLSDRAIRAQVVKNEVIEPFNIYNPNKELFSDIDWTEYELSKIFKK